MPGLSLKRVMEQESEIFLNSDKGSLCGGPRLSFLFSKLFYGTVSLIF